MATCNIEISFNSCKECPLKYITKGSVTETHYFSEKYSCPEGEFTDLDTFQLPNFIPKTCSYSDEVMSEEELEALKFIAKNFSKEEIIFYVDSLKNS